MRRLPVLIPSALAMTVFGVVAALATPPVGLTRTETSRAGLVNAEQVDFEAQKEIVVVHLTLAPGGSTGWHSHPTQGVFIADSGTFSNYGLDGDPCHPVTVSAGQAYFVPAHPDHAHLAKNETAEPVELTVIYFNVPSGDPTRLEAEAPADCPGLT